MRVVVVGAGLGGLAAAAGLRRYAPNVEVEILERDPAWDARPQGYALGMKGDGAIPALRELGVDPLVLPGAVVVEDFVFTDASGRRLMELRAGAEGPHATVRVPRSELRSALRRVAADVPIRWGSQVRRVEERADSVLVWVSEGDATVDEPIEADLVVAADGVGSAVRRQVHPDPLVPFGLTSVTGETHGRHPHPLLDGGYVMSLGPAGVSVFAYATPSGVHLSLTLHGPVMGTPSAELRARTHGWHPLVTDLVRDLDPSTVVVRAYADRDPIDRVRYGRVWLIGDAAFPMLPFQGLGGNRAIADAAELARWVGSGAADDAGAALERRLVKAGRAAVLSSRRAAGQFHTTSSMQRAMTNVGFRLADRVMRLQRRGGSVRTHDRAAAAV